MKPRPSRRARRSSGVSSSSPRRELTPFRFKRFLFAALLFLCCAVPLGFSPRLAGAQSEAPAASPTPETETFREGTVDERKERSGAKFVLPASPPQAPAVDAPPAGEYILEFNRSPVVGTRFSLRGIYDEARLGFTRPRDWKINSVKALIRYRHSPALYATRSNLTVLINGASIGSIPLNRKEGEIGNAVFDVPLAQLQNYNQVTVAALQNNSPTCTQDPYDPSLWTEILPDSKITFDFEPQPVSLDFKRYPYPIFDELSLDPNQVAYLLPKDPDESWLTATSRFQAALGRLADYRRFDTRLVESVDEVQLTERLVAIGTPQQQPALESLELPLPIVDNRILDAEDNALPPEVGVLLLTTTPDNSAPVLVATGNGSEGVTKAVQFLVQSKDREIGTGQVIFVETVEPEPSPAPRDWPGYLPTADRFQLSDLLGSDNQPYGDITVRGSDSPPLELNFQALPDDEFGSGNAMTLVYSYGPQINAKTSLIEVKLDGVALEGKRLTSINGGTRESLKVSLPGEAIRPTSKILVDFRLDARERRSCSRVTDQQLWGTLHADTRFDLNRTSAANLPDLKLLQHGFPFAAPQDLSSTAIVLPESPTPQDVMTLLEFSSRLGRLTQAQSVQLAAYTVNTLPEAVRETQHLVGIGTQAQFPFPEVYEAGGFALEEAFTRQWNQSEIQTSPDNDGVIKEVISPWNAERVLLALSGQTERGLGQVQDLLRQDPLFFQLQADTVLISANADNPEAYDPNAYNLEFLQQEAKRQIEKAPLPNRVVRFLSGSWLTIGPALVIATLMLYGVVQVYLKRVAGQQK